MHVGVYDKLFLAKSVSRFNSDRDNPLMLQDGETAETVRLELEEMMRESGLVPTKLIEGLANKTNGEGNSHDA